MKCPRCERNMEKGYFSNDTQAVQWIPEGEKPSLWKAGIAKGAVVLSKGGYWTGYRADAYYCPDCKMVILPITEP